MVRSRYPLVNVAWELTLACNMNCMHCGSSAGEPRLKELTTNEALALCDQLQALHAKIINFTGGEPLLRKDWSVIGKKIREMGMNLNVVTNGLALDEKTVTLLRKVDVSTIAISIDGGVPPTHDSLRRIPGSFKKCLTCLKMLENEDLPITVITTVHKGNIRELPLIRDHILNKVDAWQLQIAAPMGRFPSSLLLSKEEFYSLALFIASTRKQFSPKKLAVAGTHSIGYYSQLMRNTMVSPVWRGCQAGISVLGILSDGSIKGCLSLPDRYIEGNVRKKSLSALWDDETFASYNRQFSKKDLTGSCRGCKYGKKCKGGCETMSTALTGGLHGDPYCLNLVEREMII